MSIETLDFDIVTEEEWDQLRPRAAQAYMDIAEDAVDALERGEFVRVPCSDARDKRSKLMSIARRAGTRGFAVQNRFDGDIMVLRRDDTRRRGPSATAAAPRATSGSRRCALATTSRLPCPSHGAVPNVAAASFCPQQRLPAAASVAGMRACVAAPRHGRGPAPLATRPYHGSRPPEIPRKPALRTRRQPRLLEHCAPRWQKCLECTQDFPTRAHPPPLYCSEACRQRMVSRQKRYMITAACLVCGRDFLTSKYRPKRTCSRRCGKTLSWAEKRACAS
jgi:hypothetical protein